MKKKNIIITQNKLKDIQNNLLKNIGFGIYKKEVLDEFLRKKYVLPEKISDYGIEKIARHEGIRLKIYKDVAGHPTIGVGHLILPGENFDKKITKDEALKLFRKDLNKFEIGVKRLIRVETTQNEFDAMVSLSYNIGLNNFKKSSVLKYHNLNNRKKASESFLLFSKARNIKTRKLEFVQGLYNRRLKEMNMYLGNN